MVWLPPFEVQLIVAGQPAREYKRENEDHYASAYVCSQQGQQFAKGHGNKTRLQLLVHMDGVEVDRYVTLGRPETLDVLGRVLDDDSVQPLVFAQRLVTDNPDEADAESQHEINVGMIVVEMRRVDRVIMAAERKAFAPSDSGVTFHQELADVKGALGDVAALGDAIEASHDTDQCDVVIDARDDQPWKVVCFHYRSRAELEAAGVKVRDPLPATPAASQQPAVAAPGSSQQRLDQALPSTPTRTPHQLPTPEATPETKPKARRERPSLLRIYAVSSQPEPGPSSKRRKTGDEREVIEIPDSQ